MEHSRARRGCLPLPTLLAAPSSLAAAPMIILCHSLMTAWGAVRPPLIAASLRPGCLHCPSLLVASTGGARSGHPILDWSFLQAARRQDAI